MYAAQSSAGGNALGIVLILVAVLAYWAPTAVAVIRHVPNAGSVIVINVLLGWTVVGWIVALAMACRSKPAQYYNPSPPPPMPAAYYPPQENSR